MAIAMAEFGGIGVIHLFLQIKVQVIGASRVKRCQSEIIDEPYTISRRFNCARSSKIYGLIRVSGLPILGEYHELLVIWTRRDLKLVNSPALVSERMTLLDRM